MGEQQILEVKKWASSVVPSPMWPCAVSNISKKSQENVLTEALNADKAKSCLGSAWVPVEINHCFFRVQCSQLASKRLLVSSSDHLWSGSWACVEAVAKPAVMSGSPYCVPLHSPRLNHHDCSIHRFTGTFSLITAFQGHLWVDYLAREVNFPLAFSFWVHLTVNQT